MQDLSHWHQTLVRVVENVHHKLRAHDLSLCQQTSPHLQWHQVLTMSMCHQQNIGHLSLTHFNNEDWKSEHDAALQWCFYTVCCDHGCNGILWRPSPMCALTEQKRQLNKSQTIQCMSVLPSPQWQHMNKVKQNCVTISYLKLATKKALSTKLTLVQFYCMRSWSDLRTITQNVPVSRSQHNIQS